MVLRHNWLIGIGVVLALATALALILAWGGSSLAQGDIIYVDADAPGPGDGEEWTTAYTDLQDALADAEAGEQIWVAAGIYTPTWQFDSDPRSATFQMLNGVALYGGFDPSAGATEWDDRDWIANETILSGDLNGDDEPGFVNNEENSYHVFYHPHGTGLDDSAVLDGFTITGGNANGDHGVGGGMYNGSSDPTLTNCTFEGNSAGSVGGGMYNDYSSPIVTNCTFTGNSAISYAGGMFNGWSAMPRLTNCIFWGNSGGGLDGIEFSAPVLTNCILWNNSPYQIGVGAVTYSDIQGGRDGMGNIDADPLFVDPDNGDFHLGPGSPCIDAGTNAAPYLPPYDFEGDYRVLDGDGDRTAIADMGVDEYRIAHYVDANAQGANNGSTWEDAFTTLQPALDVATAGEEIWVAAGTYTPTAEHGGSGERYRSFQMVNGVAIYGGFDPDAGATGWEDRDWVENEPILSGDIGTEGDPEDNSYHVFYHPDGLALDDSAILDGFTITGGNANHPSDVPFQVGGGMVNVLSSPTLTNCTFSNNSSDARGGGIYNWTSSPVLTNCSFSHNSAAEGGGIYNLTSSSPVLTNCSFSYNWAAEGGGMNNNMISSPTLTNCTFWANSADQGGGIYNAHDSSPTLTNCILWADSPPEIHNVEDSSTPAISYSDIQGGCDADPYSVCGDGNIAADPLFVDPDNGDFHLGPDSPCIDAGSNAAPYLPPYDFEGHHRVLDGDVDGTATVDMGVDEYHIAHYVDADAQGANNGSTWQDAFTTLQSALDVATAGDEIWVASGTYTPTWQYDAADPRSATFQMESGVAIYGGFAGTETERGQRDWMANPTILSGDIGEEDNTADNSYHVFYHPDGTNLDDSAILDGFTITGGRADSDSPHNRGGGMYNDGSSPALTNLTFAHNSARYGGGMCNDNASPELTNCTFDDNGAGLDGAGMHNDLSSPTLTNCTFSGNLATNSGAMSNYDSSPTLTNCILWGNSPPEIYNSDESSTPAISYSDIQGGCDADPYSLCGDGNINDDPLFVDPDNGDLHLGSGSPCIDAGANVAPNLPPYDFEGDPRILDGDGDGTATVDMGVDEFRIHYVDVDAQGANDGSTWEDAFTNLQPALDAAISGHEIWVAAGTYTPTVQHGGTGDRYRSFQMKNGVALYGGFDPSLGHIGFEHRDWESNLTILSGDLNGDDGPGFANNGENSYHVFYHADGVDLDGTAILDGFTITGGNANHPTDTPFRIGGGMLNTLSSPALLNCTFSSNSAEDRGGGLYNWSSSPVLTNCTFSSNSANQGGGMYNLTSSSPQLTNCTFSSNSAVAEGGGMNNDMMSSPTLINCTFWSNSANQGGGIYNAYDSSPTLTNCILWADSVAEIHNFTSSATPDVSYSDIQGGCDADPYNGCGDGNIDDDPLFVDPDNGDLHLGMGSPCIDAGTNAPVTSLLYDFEGDTRIIDGDGDGDPIVDIGVDEVPLRVYLPLVLKAY